MFRLMCRNAYKRVANGINHHRLHIVIPQNKMKFLHFLIPILFVSVGCDWLSNCMSCVSILICNSAPNSLFDAL